jgi:hypothetical protein
MGICGLAGTERWEDIQKAEAYCHGVVYFLCKRCRRASKEWQCECYQHHTECYVESLPI